MKTYSIPSIASTILLAVALTGCVGTGPNTQQDAVAGGALGAITGAIIGNNSGSHNALGGAAIGAAVGAIAGGTIGNAQDHQDGTIYAGTAPGQVVYEQAPPPPPAPVAEVVVACPGPEFVWLPGYYSYGPGGYFWISGRWALPPRHHSHYFAPHWEHGPRGYIWVGGAWR
jgi:hypothetical protein